MSFDFGEMRSEHCIFEFAMNQSENCNRVFVETHKNIQINNRNLCRISHVYAHVIGSKEMHALEADSLKLTATASF